MKGRKDPGVPNALSGPAGFITGAGHAHLSNNGYVRNFLDKVLSVDLNLFGLVG
jgi:hypothetical protein